MSASMPTEKPLNVRVAEALGWSGIVFSKVNHAAMPDLYWCGISPTGDPACGATLIPPYGDDTPEGWAATGVFVRRFNLLVAPGRPDKYAKWAVSGPGGGGVWADTPCEAIAEWVARFGAEALKGGEK